MTIEPSLNSNNAADIPLVLSFSTQSCSIDLFRSPIRLQSGQFFVGQRSKRRQRSCCLKNLVWQREKFCSRDQSLALPPWKEGSCEPFAGLGKEAERAERIGLSPCGYPTDELVSAGKEGMKRARFSEEQIIEVLKEAEGGAKVSELCRRHGISDATFYTWRSKYGGLEISEMRRLRQLEEENRRLKSIVADQALDIRALKDVLAKNGYGPR